MRPKNFIEVPCAQPREGSSKMERPDQGPSFEFSCYFRKAINTCKTPLGYWITTNNCVNMIGGRKRLPQCGPIFSRIELDILFYLPEGRSKNDQIKAPDIAVSNDLLLPKSRLRKEQWDLDFEPWIRVLERCVGSQARAHSNKANSLGSARLVSSCRRWREVVIFVIAL